MNTQWVYGVELRREKEDGRVYAYAAAMPDAIASGADEADALREVAQAIDAAVRGRIKFGMDLQAPSAGLGGWARFEDTHRVALSPELSAKASIYTLWRASGLSKSALAERMAVNEKEVRRLLDPDHTTGLGRLAEAAAVCGGRLVIGAERVDHAAQVEARLRALGYDPRTAPLDAIRRADLDVSMSRVGSRAGTT